MGFSGFWAEIFNVYRIAHAGLLSVLNFESTGSDHFLVLVPLVLNRMGKVDSKFIDLMAIPNRTTLNDLCCS